MTKLEVVYHNTYGKRNKINIDMDRLFPCDKDWLDRLIKIAILGSDNPPEYLRTITEYLAKRHQEAKQIAEEKPTQKNKKTERQYRACLDLMGGKYGQ